LENYEIIAPNRRAYATAESWTEACDKAVDLSLRWGVLFRVRRINDTPALFQKERLAVLEASMNYIEMARKWPKSISTEKAKTRFEAAKRKLDTLIQVQNELKGSDFEERHVLSHPIKAFRTTE